MKVFSHSTASEAVAALGLSGANLQVAQQWLAAWSDGRPPRGARFFAKCDGRNIPAFAIFEVSQGESLRCVLAGAYFGMALGFDLSGQNMLILTPAADRAMRMERAWSIGDGAILSGKRDISVGGAPATAHEEVYLPLADSSKESVRTYLMHTNWRPVGDAWVQGRVTTNLELVHELQASPLG